MTDSPRRPPLPTRAGTLKLKSRGTDTPAQPAKSDTPPAWRKRGKASMPAGTPAEPKRRDQPTDTSRDDSAPRGFGPKPARGFGDKPARPGFNDRPRRDDDERPNRPFGDRPPRRDDDAPRGFGPKPARGFGDKPARSGFNDRPRREGDERPNRPSGDRPPRRDDDAPRGFGAKPARGFGDKPARSGFNDRPRRDDDERPNRPSGDRPPRRDDDAPRGFGAKPTRGFGDKPARSGFNDRPRRDDDERPNRPSGDRPPRRDDDAPRGFGAKPTRGFGDKPARSGFNDRPRRDDDERPNRPFSDRPPRRDDDVPATTKPPRHERKAWTGEPRPEPTPSPLRDDGSIRLSKRMTELGLCSRREADEYIEKGWVRVDGRVVSELGARVKPGQTVELDRRGQTAQDRRVTILLNKPVGYVSGQAEDGYQPASVLITADNRWEEDPSETRFLRTHHRGLAPAGRLDIDSHGLLVFTQDGRIARALIGDDSTIEKEYHVRVEGALSEAGLATLNHGLSLDGQPLRPAKVSWLNEDQLRFVLREGKKRQIRRMCELVGLNVVGLKRVRIGQVMLGKLPVGQWRYLGADEVF